MNRRTVVVVVVASLLVVLAIAEIVATNMSGAPALRSEIQQGQGVGAAREP